MRITKKDKQEYNRLVKNSRSKIKNAIKKYGASIQDIQNGELVQINLQEKLNVPKLENFTSRKEFNEWKYETEKFNKGRSSRAKFKKNKYGVAATEHAITVIENLTRKEQKNAIKRKESLMEKPFVSGGEVQGTVGQRLLTMARPPDVNIPKNFNFSDVRNLDRLKTVFENKKRRSDPSFYDERLARFKDVYIESLSEMFNSDANDVIDKIVRIPDEDFYELYKTHDEMDIIFNPYPNKEIEGMDENMLSDLRRVERYLDEYFSGNMNPLFFLRNK